jgi:hypothetical protein
MDEPTAPDTNAQMHKPGKSTGATGSELPGDHGGAGPAKSEKREFQYSSTWTMIKVLSFIGAFLAATAIAAGSIWLIPAFWLFPWGMARSSSKPGRRRNVAGRCTALRISLRRWFRIGDSHKHSRGGRVHRINCRWEFGAPGACLHCLVCRVRAATGHKRRRLPVYVLSFLHVTRLCHPSRQADGEEEHER